VCTLGDPRRDARACGQPFTDSYRTGREVGKSVGRVIGLARPDWIPSRRFSSKEILSNWDFRQQLGTIKIPKTRTICQNSERLLLPEGRRAEV